MVWRNSARTWSRSGSPLATSRGRRQLATSRTRRRRVRWLMAGRPSRCHSRAIVQALGWASSRQSRWPSRWLPRRADPPAAGRQARRGRGCCNGGSSGAPSSDRSPAGQRWWRLTGRGGPARSGLGASRGGAGRGAGPAGRRGSLPDTSGWRTRWGDAYFRRPRRVGGAVEGFSDPRGYCTSGQLQPGLRHNCRQAASRMPSTLLSCPVGTRRGPRSGAHGARSGRRPAPPSGPSSSRRRVSRPTAWARGHGPAPAPPGTAAGG